MKLIAIIASVLLTAMAQAETPVVIEEANQVTCAGQTYDGDRYNVSVYYTLDPTWLNQPAPYSIFTGKRAFVSIDVVRKGKTIFQEALYTNDLVIEQTDDSRSYQLKKIETKKVIQNGAVVFNDVTTDFLNINMVAESPSSFDFELKSAYGDFKNGRCTSN